MIVQNLDLSNLAEARGWKIAPMWSIARRVDRKGYPDAELLSVYREYGVIRKSDRDDNHNVESEDLSAYKYVKAGDLVLNKMKTWQGSLGVSAYDGIVSPAYFTCELSPTVYGPYIHYLLRSNPYIAMYGALSKGIRVGQWDLPYEEFRDIPVLLPPLDEQRRIADFLEIEIARLDILIASRRKQEDLVESLANGIRKKFLIGPDTEFLPLKRIASLTYGDALAREVRLDGDVNVMSSGGVSGIHNLANTLGPVIVIGRKGSFGSVHWSDSPVFVIDTAYFIDKKNSSLHLRWLFHVLKISKLSELSVDVGIPGLSREVAYAKSVPNPPPLHEQVSQAKNIDHEINHLNSLSRSINLSATLFANFKSSLITAAVTGTFDVTTGRSVA